MPAINVGTRQQNRGKSNTQLNCNYTTEAILDHIQKAKLMKTKNENMNFGAGNSAQLFLDTLQNQDIWQLSAQKQFRDIN